MTEEEEERYLQSCQDSLANWHNSRGEDFTCDWYSRFNRCERWGDSFENMGTTANQACCVCGGGSDGGDSGDRDSDSGNGNGSGEDDSGGDSNSGGNSGSARSGSLCPSPSNNAFEEEVVRLINEARSEGVNCGGLLGGYHPPTTPLTRNTNLDCAARFHSDWMAENNQFTHDSPGGELGDDAPERITNSGYFWKTYGENIAYGQTTPSQVMDAWLRSTGHCENIMDGRFRDVGVGYVLLNGVPYWTQDFGLHE